MLRSSKLPSIIACSFLLAASPTTANAQDYAMSPVQFPSAFNVNAMAQIGKVYNSPSARELPSRNSVASARPEIFLFNPSPTRRRANLAKFIEKSRATDPVGATKMEQLFASTDVIAALGKGMAPYGLRTNNVADAYTIYWVNAWQAAHGDASDASRSTMQAVQRQSANALGSTPEFMAATEASKQEVAEAFLLQGAIIAELVQQMKDDPAMMRQLGAAVRKGAKASGLDLDAMTLTEQGFVPSGKTGAAEPVPGAPEQALAANAATPAPKAANDSAPPYLLMAAAGGAGIGGVFLLGKVMARRG